MSRIKTLTKRYEGYKFKVEHPILDIGGGDGKFLESQGIDMATILDLSQEKNPKYKYLEKDITKELNLDSKYKTIFIMEVLEHLKNPEELILQAYNLLDDDGRVYVSVPYTQLNASFSAGNWDPGHIIRWTLGELKRLMEMSGFDTEIIQTRRRFKGLGFFIPHCWIVLKLTKKNNIRKVEI